MKLTIMMSGIIMVKNDALATFYPGGKEMQKREMGTAAKAGDRASRGGKIVDAGNSFLPCL